MALPLAGKRSRFKRKDLIDYLGKERLGLKEHSIVQTEREFQSVFPKWEELIHSSFLEKQRQVDYLALIKKRSRRLKWG